MPPIYEYQCAKGHITEVMHGIDERATVLCEQCWVYDRHTARPEDPVPYMERILSPTRTNFVHAGGRKP